MNRLLLNIVLAVIWMLLTSEIDFTNFIEGLAVGFMILSFSRYASRGIFVFKKVPKAIGLLVFFLYELVVANLRVAKDIISPNQKFKPAIISVSLTASTDLEITFLANMITLTPGTLTLDISSDKRVIYIHAMSIEDPEEFKMKIKNGFERKLLEVTR